MVKGVLVKPEIVTWAIRSAGQTVEELKEKIEKIDQWTKEDSDLKVSEINLLSKELNVPFGYFFLTEPPIENLELLQYRTLNNLELEKPSRELIDTIKDMEKKQLFMKEILVEDGYPSLEFVNSISIEDDVVKVAEFIRKTLNLKIDWNKNKSEVFNILKDAISNNRILVMQNGVVGHNNNRPLDLNEFRAMVIVDDYVPLIFLNAKDSVAGKTFSLMHELAHIWLGVNNIYNEDYKNKWSMNNKDIELFCNEIAAELLVPMSEIQNKVITSSNIMLKIEEIAKNYGVSELVACIRLKSINKITTETFNKTYSILLEKMNENLLNKEKRQPGGNYYNTMGSRLDINFVKSVNRKAREGKILYSEAYNLIGAKGKVYDNLIAHMEGRN